MAETKIEWAHFTYNPWIGCTKVSMACDFCYAETENKFRGWAPGWGPNAPRYRTKTRVNLPKWNRAAAELGVRYRVFVASLADVGDNHRSIDPAWRRQLVDDVRANRNLDFLFLTKRPQNMPKLYPDLMEEWPDNVWMGATVENQVEANRRIPSLLAVPAPILFLSCEPLLEWLNLHELSLPGTSRKLDAFFGLDSKGVAHFDRGIDWVIAGGESGGPARPTKPDWFRSLRDQCASADVPFFFKQWGEWVSVSEVAGPGAHFQFEDGATVRRVGKNRSGRTLDGVLHDEFPTTRWVA
ncbi:phage Gp37/Gp68 family protein [Roseibium sp. Sym1]|uniref:phage Gp37/Gp68 family protein n=1 Tax=Roseibium sp. Sym1 TaxID=3016006 RepID=UPI0022B36F61|nr:phage Gp37/Gp68 family protein [Roseibium sp. Sym1]